MKRFQRTFRAFVLSLCLYGLTHASVNSTSGHSEHELEAVPAALQQTPAPLMHVSVKDSLQRYAHELMGDIAGVSLTPPKTQGALQMHDKFLTLREEINLSSAAGIYHAWEICCATNQALIAVAYEDASCAQTSREVVRKSLQALRVHSNIRELFVALDALYLGKPTPHADELMEACKNYGKNALTGTHISTDRAPPVWLPHWMIGRVYAEEALSIWTLPEQKVLARGIQHRSAYFFRVLCKRPYAVDHIKPQDCSDFAVDVVQGSCECGLETIDLIDLDYRSFVDHCLLKAAQVDQHYSGSQAKENSACELFQLFYGREKDKPRLQEVCAPYFPISSSVLAAIGTEQTNPSETVPFRYYLVRHLLPLMRRIETMFDSMQRCFCAESISPQIKEFLDEKRYGVLIDKFFQTLHSLTCSNPALLHIYQRVTDIASSVACELLYGFAQNPHTPMCTLMRSMRFCSPEEISVVNDMLVGCTTEGALYLKKSVDVCMEPEKLEPWRRYARTRCRWFFIKLAERLFDQKTTVFL